MDSLFGTSGIRAEASFFTEQFCFDMGRTFALFLKAHKTDGKVAVGRDPRLSGQNILNFYSSGLIYEGREVHSMGIVPIPALNYLLKKDPSFGAATMVTGSHVKETMNGLKFFFLGEEISKEEEKEITAIYEKIKNQVLFKDLSAKILSSDLAFGFYENLLWGMADKPYPSWKVVVDPGNGAWTGFAVKLLSRFDLTTVGLNNSLDLAFISRDTEQDGVFKDLQKAVVEQKADLGIAFDADGDRVVFIDEKGNFIPGDYSCSLIAGSSSSSTIVTPVGSSQVVDSLGKKVIRCQVGSPFVIKAMKENNSLFGFEANGGGISGEIMFTRDGGTTMVKMLNTLKKHNGSLSSLVAILPRYFQFRTKVDCPRESNQKVLTLAEKEFFGKRIERIDGLKIWVSDSSWILFRPSNNAPEFRVFCEAKTKTEAENLGQKGVAFVKMVIK